MKLKLIATAIALTLSAASHATNIVLPTTAGGSDVLLSVWEQGAAGAPDQSFTLDTGINMATFLANPTSLSATLLSTDSLWTSFLASSNVASLQWAVEASGKVVSPNPADGTGKQPSILSTITAGTTAAAVGQFTVVIGGMSGQNLGYINALNQIAPNPQESVNPVGTNAYFQGYQMDSWNLQTNGVNGPWTASNALGTSAQVLQLTNSKNSPDVGYANLLAGTISFAQSGANYVLSYNVAAVPEAPASMMGLAGLGLLAFMAARRRKDA
ncbi:MAG: PEP-CTERM sorting domain-containing protein [Caulobacter sp.]|nr:PEP-CTERM sorting domain-containing protein [Vitreoscilla sp.]